jgi:hypothetical protein
MTYIKVLTKNYEIPPPPNGWVKVNTDAGFYVETGEASTGILIRSENGQVLLSGQKVLRKCSAEETEACLQGIKGCLV